MKMKQLISVIVPVYMIEQYLPKCIDSICRQTWDNLQIILVDDGSKDLSGLICDTYAAKDTRIKVIHKSNGGLVSARKAGLQEATGDYVIYVDGDDWIEPDLCEVMLKAMQNAQTDLVAADNYMDMGEEILAVRGKLPYGNYTVDEIIPVMLCDKKYDECRLKPYVWTKMFKRELLEQVQYCVDERITVGEDVAVTYPYVLRCHNVTIFDYCGYHYVQHMQSMVHQRKADEWQRNIVLFKQLYECFRKEKYADILLWELNQYVKLLMLLRNLETLDKDKGKGYLYPFGYLEKNKEVMIYGAGDIGQSVYRYLTGVEGVHLAGWIDQKYIKYRQLGYDVKPIDYINEFREKNIQVVIAINSRSVSMSVYKWLVEQKINEKDIRWLTDEFLELDLLSEIMNYQNRNVES